MRPNRRVTIAPARRKPDAALDEWAARASQQALQPGRLQPDPPGGVTDTSRAAAASVAPIAHTVRADVLRYVRATGGATCDEVEAGIGLTHQTASARVKELADRGQLRDIGWRRATRSGRLAIVWVAGPS